MKKTIHRDPNYGNKEYARIIGTNILRMMKQQKLTPKELAQMLDIQYNQLMGYENGKHLPGVVVLYKLSVAFNQPMEMFLEESVSKSSNEEYQQKMNDSSDLCYVQKGSMVIDQMISRLNELIPKFATLRRKVIFPSNTMDSHCWAKMKEVSASILICLCNMKVSMNEKNTFEVAYNEAIDGCKIIEFLLKCVAEWKSISDTDMEEYYEDIGFIRNCLESL